MERIRIHDISADLRARLERSLSQPRTIEQSVAALAHLDLHGTLAWLLAAQDNIRSTLSSSAISRIVDTVVRACASATDPGLLPDAHTVISCFKDFVSPDLAAEIIGAPSGEPKHATFRPMVHALLTRDPQNQRLLHIATELAIASNDISSAHRLLTRLARVEDSVATVYNVFKRRGELPPVEGPHIRAALLSSFTVDSLLPYVDLEFRDLGLVPELYVAPFNSWVRELVSDTSQLRSFQPEIVLLAISIDDFVPELAASFSSSHAQEKGQALLTQLGDVARDFRRWSNAPLIVHSLYSAFRSPLVPVDGGGSSPRWLDLLNLQLFDELTAIASVYVLNMNELLLHRRHGAFDTPKLRYMARMRLGHSVLGEVARAYARYVAPLKGLRRKCVVLDLDNTLWGGIVGEDGPHRIQLGNTSPGIEYQDLQRYLLSLTRQGILLAINSKNNREDALEVIRSHEGMVLREEYFSAIRINWLPKTDNMVSIAKELDIGLDALIFLDDNPHERELMRQVLPDVLVPDLPTDPSLYRQAIELLPQLQTLALTEEDRHRVEHYTANRHRKQVRVSAQSVEDYLESLRISVEITHATEASLPRIHQLFQRTNQFNLTSRRYEIDQLATFARDPAKRLYSLTARDRFGDHGLVAAALVFVEPGCWSVDSILMSCRVIGYGIETALLALLSNDARSAGANSLIGLYIESTKNAPASDFYRRHGFIPETPQDRLLRWHLDLTHATVSSPPWITCEAIHDS